MENDRLKAKYDRLYRETESVFGGKDGNPESLVPTLASYLSQGSLILELGAGQGRNGIWLARHGFKVEAREISSVGVGSINKIAAAEQIPLRAIIGDARAQIEGQYDAIVSTYMLHHLTSEEGKNLIRKMQSKTKPGGYNLLTAFTTKGDFFAKNPATDKFYVNPDELKDLYSDWSVIDYEEVRTEAAAKREDGDPMSNLSAKILAQKLV